MSAAPQPSVLVGLDLWAVTFAVNIMSLQFGRRRKVPTKRDPEREVGEYALHAESPHEARANGVTVELRRLVEERGPMKVLRVLETPLGTLILELEGGVVVRISGDPLASDDDDGDGEQWRIFTPGGKAPHLMFVGGRYREE